MADLADKLADIKARTWLRIVLYAVAAFLIVGAIVSAYKVATADPPPDTLTVEIEVVQ